MKEILSFVVIVVVWIVLTKVIFPKFGLPT